MTLPVPAAVYLTDAARRICGGFLGDYHRQTEVHRLMTVFANITPEEYTRIWNALRDTTDASKSRL